MSLKVFVCFALDFWYFNGDYGSCGEPSSVVIELKMTALEP